MLLTALLGPLARKALQQYTEKEEEEEEEENSLLLDANVTWGNILASCCGFKTWSRQGLGTCLVEVQGGGWLPVEGTSQDEVVDEP